MNRTEKKDVMKQSQKALAGKRKSLDEKIAKQKVRVEAEREKYNSEVERLKVLMDQSDTLKREILLGEMQRSGKTEEQIIRFLRSANE